ncbi:MAG: hypothetical protein AB8U25_04350 [Rickettsiales endosymbiont of Dermacentor nuttalli]
MRNISSSIAISIANVVLSNSVRINHTFLTEYIIPYNSKIVSYYATNFNNNTIFTFFNILDQEVTTQNKLIPLPT